MDEEMERHLSNFVSTSAVFKVVYLRMVSEVKICFN